MLFFSCHEPNRGVWCGKVVGRSYQSYARPRVLSCHSLDDELQADVSDGTGLCQTHEQITPLGTWNGSVHGDAGGMRAGGGGNACI